MFDYIQKFNQLPAEVREKISNSQMTATIDELEQKYGVELVKTIMQVMTKDLSLDYLGLYFMEEFGLTGETADKLVQDLYKYVFSAVADYLGIESVEASDNKIKAESTETVGKDEAKVKDLSAPSQDQTVVQTPAGQPIVDVTKINAPVKEFFQPQKSSVDHKIDQASVNQPATPKTAETVPIKTSVNSQPQNKSQQATKTKTDLAVTGQSAAPSLTSDEGQELESDKILDKVIGQVKIIFSSQQANQRLHQVIRTYLRGVRKRAEVKMLLTNPFQKGGLGLAEEDADEILALADKHKDDFAAAIARETAAGYPASHILPAKAKDKHSVPTASFQKTKQKQPLSKIVTQGERDVPYDFKKLAASAHSQADKAPEAKQKAQETKKVKEQVATGHQGQQSTSPAPSPILKLHGEDKLSDQILDHKSVVKADKQTEIKKSVQDKSTADSAATTTLPKRSQTISAKPRLDDVTYKPKVMGPIDELRQMTLLDFRRLNPDPTRAAQKIKEKIELIGEEQYAKRVEAIKAWRQSPVNKMYANIGHQSIIKAEPVEKIIAAEKQAGRECLTISEFEAIMDLNKELRF